MHRFTAATLLSLLLLFTVGSHLSAADLETADRLFKAKKWEQAREAYEAALPQLEGNDQARALRQIGYTFQITHKHDKALPYFQRVLKMKDIDVEHISGSWLRLGYSLRLLKRGEEGIAALNEVPKLKDAPATHVAEALLYAAWEHNTREEFESALAKFRRVADVAGVHTNYIATAQLSIGRILQGQHKYKEAIKAYEEIANIKTVAATNRARARVYILECEALLAGDTPFHIKPYVTKVTQSSAKLFWVSQGDIPAGKVTVKFDGTKRTFEPQTTPLNDTICHLHVAELNGLQPNTSYQYTVDCGNQQASGSFKSAPAPGTPISFSLIGDTQSYHTGLQPLLDAMAADKTDFTLHVGDITDRGNLWGEWKGSFFDPGHGYLSDRTFWPVYGNHDGGPYFPALFELQKQYWYSFDWGDAHVIVLDSYGAGSGGRGRQEQLAWLKQDLEANDRPWTFVALHVPMVATRRGMKWFGADDFLPLLEQHEVDIVFSGHHPHYRRYRPIGTRGKKPILHITSGGGGGPVGGYMPSPLLAQGIDLNHYCKIRVDGPKLLLTAHAINGAVIDRFELTKSTDTQLAKTAVETDQARQLISRYQELLTDRTYELRLTTTGPSEAGESVELLLDLSKLPRGPLDPAQFGEDETLIVESAKESAWQIPRQTFRLRSGIGRFRATVPKSAAPSGAALKPNATVKLQLQKGDHTFEPVEAVTRIQLVNP